MSVAVAVAARKRRKILAAFRDAGALCAEDARTLEELGLKSSVILRRMVRTGVLVECGGGRYCLDEAAAARAQRRERRWRWTSWTEWTRWRV